MGRLDTTPPQLGLSLSLNEDARWERFVAAHEASPALERLRQILGPAQGLSYALHVPSGQGLSFLCQAFCRELDQRGLAVQYLPLASLLEAGATPDLLDNLESFDWVCLDDVATVLHHREWEEALFHLFNALRDRKSGMMLASSEPFTRVPFDLADLASRFRGSEAIVLPPLDDEALQRFLRTSIEARGLVVSDDVAEFLLRRLPRQPKVLAAHIDTLDTASLAAQRRLSVPFVKQVLDL